MDEADCPTCGAPLVSITIHVGAGPRTLCSCSRCDRRWWMVEGELTDLDGVIDDLGEPSTPRARLRR
ncbi:MAG: hypothetical protein ACE5GB_01345 [Acidimicrobiales bacterium]